MKTQQKTTKENVKNKCRYRSIKYNKLIVYTFFPNKESLKGPNWDTCPTKE